MSRSACVVPFSTLDISPDGTPVVCCQAPVQLTVDGRPATMLRDPLDAIWNAPEIVDIRSAMARGEQPEVCRVCWNHESVAPTSLRRLMNENMQALMGAEWSLDAFMRESARTGQVLTARPRWYQLQLGNTCNLKCRSCNPASSSRIASDPVHRAWLSGSADVAPLVIPRASAWYRDSAKLAELFEDGSDGDVLLSLLGGEPFLIEEVWELLRVLVKRGWSRRIALGLVTNGTRRRAELEDLAPAFRNVYVSVSVDGAGPLFEYLRHGASWPELIRNIEWLQRVPNTIVGGTPTLQNSNALDAVNIFRFLDERGVNAHFNVLTEPRHLAATNLPPRVRRIAAARLRTYLDEDCRFENRTVVQSWAELLEPANDEFDPELFREFITFTNDLDASRRESLADVAPELFALLRASGVRWTEERRYSSVLLRRGDAEGAPSGTRRINRTVSANDAIYALYANTNAESYFESAAQQADGFDALLRAHGHAGLGAIRAVADFASHYGRITRVLHARAPHAVVYACDIDRHAVDFCARELGSVPVITGWRPDEDDLPRDLDLIVSISLLTHTPLDHWRRALRAWFDMLAPGGFVAFTILSEGYVDPWLIHEMDEYGAYPDEQRVAAARELQERGFAFVALPEAQYGGESFYGVTFATKELVRNELTAAGFELLEIATEASVFSQDLVFARKLGERDAIAMPVRNVNREARVVALYDPRCYAQSSDAESIWSRLVASQPPRPLPTDLGYCDPRVPEVREAQAAVAREHGVDAFCYIYPWWRSGPLWDAPLRELLLSGRPDFPFCLMWSNEERVRVTSEDADRVLAGLIPYLRDPRYLRYDGRPLLVVRDVVTLIEPRTIVARWRAAAAEQGLGEIHLCAVEPIPADALEDLGFDSALELPSLESPKTYAELAAASLARTRPQHLSFRGVLAQREPFDVHNVEHYELWLRTAIENAGAGPVFVRAWNEWAGGAYLEPDDRDGREFLAATRRAVRGPASGLVLLRRLRDSLGNVDGKASQFLADLERVVSGHERSRDELAALVEAAYTAPQSDSRSGQRWVPVAASHLAPSTGRVSVDRIGPVMGAELHEPDRQVILEGDTVAVTGWAHVGDRDPGLVDLFLVLTAVNGTEERVYRLHERNVRPDVTSAFPGYPDRCGFAGTLAITELLPGTYRVGIVQRTPEAAFYDATPIAVRRD